MKTNHLERVFNHFKRFEKDINLLQLNKEKVDYVLTLPQSISELLIEELREKGMYIPYEGKKSYTGSFIINKKYTININPVEGIENFKEYICFTV